MYVLAIIVFIGLMTLLFSQQIEHHHNPNQDVIAGRTDDGRTLIRLQRNRQGHYIATGAIDGVRAECMIDTGATDVAVSAAIAKAAGLHVGAEVQTSTANGIATAYTTTIGELRLGGIVEHDVAALIVPTLEEGQILLGMSFLERLDFSQEGDELIVESRRTTYP